MDLGSPLGGLFIWFDMKEKTKPRSSSSASQTCVEDASNFSFWAPHVVISEKCGARTKLDAREDAVGSLTLIKVRGHQVLRLLACSEKVWVLARHPILASPNYRGEQRSAKNCVGYPPLCESEDDLQTLIFQEFSVSTKC